MRYSTYILTEIDDLRMLSSGSASEIAAINRADKRPSMDVPLVAEAMEACKVISACHQVMMMLLQHTYSSNTRL